MVDINIRSAFFLPVSICSCDIHRKHRLTCVRGGFSRMRFRRAARIIGIRWLGLAWLELHHCLIVLGSLLLVFSAVLFLYALGLQQPPPVGIRSWTQKPTTSATAVTSLPVTSRRPEARAARRPVRFPPKRRQPVRRQPVRSRRRVVQPPRTVPPTVRTYPGDAEDFSSSCGLCKLITAWLVLTRRENSSEFNCLQLATGFLGKQLDDAVLVKCTADLCSKLFGKPLMRLVRCQNFILSNRAKLAQLPVENGTMRLSGIRATMSVLCDEMSMCPESSQQLGLFDAAEFSSALVPADCAGFRLIVKNLVREAHEARKQAMEDAQYTPSFATTHYMPYDACRCRVKTMLDACAKSFPLPGQARLLYRCVNIVQMDSRLSESILCTAVCGASESNHTAYASAAFGQCQQILKQPTWIG
eukprot:scpid75353/ scgid4323/ 